MSAAEQAPPPQQQQQQSPVKKIAGALTSLFGKVVGAIEDERAAFVAEQQRLQREAAFASTPAAAAPPWADLGSDVSDDTRAKVLAAVLPLTRSSRTFLSAPPPDAEGTAEEPPFLFNFEAALPAARAALESDPRLQAARHSLVPRKVSEEAFWRAWFWRLHLIKVAYGVSWPTPGVSLPLTAPAATARLLQHAEAARSAEEAADRAWEAELRAALMETQPAAAATKESGAAATAADATAWEREVEAELSEAAVDAAKP